MPHLIHKRSTPGWTKEFPTQDDARKELLSHICFDCMLGDHPLIDTTERHIVGPPNKEIMGDLLGTPCGCEYEYEAAQ